MNISKYISIAFAALIVSACTDEVKDIITPENPEDGGNKEEEVVEMIPVTVTVTETSSRVSHTDNGNTITVAWEEGDKIYLGSPTEDTSDKCINADGSGFTTLNIDASSISEDKKTANFTGEIPHTLNGKTLLAFYGKAENLKVNGGNVIMDFTEQTQSTENLAHLKDYDLMSAVVQNYDGSNNINLQFKHEGAIFKVKLTQLPTAEKSISTVVLSLPEGTNSFVTSKSFDANGKGTNKQTTNKLELNIDGVSDATYDAVFTLCPTTFNSDINISVPVIKASGTYSYTDKINISNATLEAGKYYWTPDILLTIDNTLKGEGTADSPYIIDNVEKFNKIADDADAYYNITQDMDFGGATITPIETFAGTLDGGNKTLSNFNIAKNNSNSGLFIQNSGTIKNLILDGITSNITGDYNGSTNGNTNSGGILAGTNTKSGIIENCIIKNSSLTANTSQPGSVGGFVGRNLGTVDGCYTEGTLTVTTEAQKYNIGGLIGNNEQGTVLFSSIREGATVNYNSTIASSSIGGLIGWSSSGTIKGCYANATVTSTNYANSIGGLIGSAWSGVSMNFTLEASYSAGRIDCSAGSASGASIGGLIGNAGGNTSKYITACYTKTTLPQGASSNNAIAQFIKTHKNTTCSACYFSHLNKASCSGPFEGSAPTYSENLGDIVIGLNAGLSTSEYEFVLGSDNTILIQKK